MQSPARSVDVGMNAKVANSNVKSAVDDVPDDGDNWDLEGVAQLDGVEQVGVK